MAIASITENTRHIPWVPKRSVITFIPMFYGRLTIFLRRNSSPPKGFVPLFAEFEVFLKYNLPEYIRDLRKYITIVLTYEAVTTIIMDLEKCFMKRQQESEWGKSSQPVLHTGFSGKR